MRIKDKKSCFIANQIRYFASIIILAFFNKLSISGCISCSFSFSSIFLAMTITSNPGRTCLRFLEIASFKSLFVRFLLFAFLERRDGMMVVNSEKREREFFLFKIKTAIEL